MKGNGLGRHLTSPAYIEERKKFAMEKKREKREKVQRKKDWGMKKTAKEKAEIEWKTYFAKCKQADANWRGQCQGLPKSRHPPKPTRLLKADFIAKAVQEEMLRIQEELDDVDNVEDEGEDETEESDWESVADDEDDEDD